MIANQIFVLCSTGYSICYGTRRFSNLKAELEGLRGSEDTVLIGQDISHKFRVEFSIGTKARLL